MCTAGTGASLSWGTPSHCHTPPCRAPERAEGTEGMHESRLTMVNREPRSQTARAPVLAPPFLSYVTWASMSPSEGNEFR